MCPTVAARVTVGTKMGFSTRRYARCRPARVIATGPTRALLKSEEPKKTLYAVTEFMFQVNQLGILLRGVIMWVK